MLDDGYTVAVAVKNKKAADKLAPDLKAIKSHGFLSRGSDGRLRSGTVDDIVLITETEATYGAYENAQAILRARGHRNDAEYDTTKALAAAYDRSFLFGELLRECHSRAMRRTAIWLLIDDGVFIPENLEPIDELTRLIVRR